MKTNLTNYILAIILLSGCDRNDIKVETTKNNSGCVEYWKSHREKFYNYRGYYPDDQPVTMGVKITNTSRSKYIEATVEYRSKDYGVRTEFIKLKPGIVHEECESEDCKISILGEREIFDND